VGRQARVPDWLSFDWWWLLIINLPLAVLYTYYRSFIAPSSVLGLVCILVQADWLRRADDESRGIYWMVGMAVVWTARICFVLVCGPHALVANMLRWLFLALYLVGVVEMCRDFGRIFSDLVTPPPQMTRLLAFLFGPFYFQFHLHRLAVFQRTLESGTCT
jgi:hypothetical protein